MECCEHATTIVASSKHAAIQERTVEEPPDSKRLARSFEPTEGIKEIPMDPSNPDGKAL